MTTATGLSSFTAGSHLHVRIVAIALSFKPPGRPRTNRTFSIRPSAVTTAWVVTNPLIRSFRASSEYPGPGIYVHFGSDTPSTPPRYRFKSDKAQLSGPVSRD